MQNVVNRKDKTMKNLHRNIIKIVFLSSAIMASTAYGYYTTKDQDIIDRKTGEKVLLQGFGLGCWLLPEGYMWGLRTLDRPRQLEKAIVDLIGPQDANEFWRLYHDNFVTEGDIKAMKAWGVNSVRIALLASMLQPRDGQPAAAPYLYSEEGFSYLDNLVRWCDKYKVGVIWDMHGAPGGQNAENISDSDGTARLWTEKGKYWPLCIDLWYKIAERYRNEDCIIGYDLLNEPLLRRYEGIDVKLLRQFYVELTEKIRTVDPNGIIFIEGDDWAQNFSMLEPIDWDKHLVLAFHSYPPTSSQNGLKRWDDFRKKYNIPLWHGETGEQGPPYIVNTVSTEFLNSANVGWNWWTHKKFDGLSQPWDCPKTEGFQKIINFWKGTGSKPSKEQAKKWLFDQARKTHSDKCQFIPDMVRSLVPLNPDSYLASRGIIAPKIIQQPKDVGLEVGDSASLMVRASGYPVNYQWKKNGRVIADANSFRLKIQNPVLEDNKAKYTVTVSNKKGSDTSRKVTLTVKPYSGPIIAKASVPVGIDGVVDDVWENAELLPLANVALRGKPSAENLSGAFKILRDQTNLYLLVQVTDDLKMHTAEESYENDGIEIYIDYDNSKSDRYDSDDFMFRYVWSESEVLSVIGNPGPGVKGAQKNLDKGYIMEIAIPWKAIGGTPKEGQYIGIDVHVNDNDNLRRDCKITWKAKRDISHQTPSVFGTMKLSE
jgi:aryl-phospho-beta-D-glucosidase BglC (GH1 family)